MTKNPCKITNGTADQPKTLGTTDYTDLIITFYILLVPKLHRLFSTTNHNKRIFTPDEKADIVRNS